MCRVSWAPAYRCGGRRRRSESLPQLRVVEIAQLPDIIRGYEDVKEANVLRFWTRAVELDA